MNRRRALVILTVILMAVALSSCDILMGFLGTSIETRIGQFEDALNEEDRTNINEHFHPSMDNHQQIADSVVFDTGPLSYDYYKFTIGDPEVDGSIATCDFENGIGITGTLTLTMEQDGFDYKIRKLTLSIDGTSVTYTLMRVGADS